MITGYRFVTGLGLKQPGYVTHLLHFVNLEKVILMILNADIEMPNDL